MQLRGTNGVGKSTAVRGFLEKYGRNAELRPYRIGSALCPITVEKTHRFAIIGDYSQTTPGVDRISSKEVLLQLLDVLMKEGFESIIFEGSIMCKTFKLSSMINTAAARRGYLFRCAVLYTTFEIGFERVLNRSGDRGQKPENWMAIQENVFVSSRKLKSIGVPITYIDTSHHSIDDTKSIIGSILQYSEVKS